MSPSLLSQNMTRLQRWAFTLGLGSLPILVWFYVQNPDAFFQAYLMAFLFWLAPTLGSLAIVCLHSLTGGAWGFAIRRLLEAGMRNIPLMALLALPILLGGVHNLYEWSHADVVAHDPILQQKSVYLNETFFRIRAVVYFAFWFLTARTMLTLSAEFDRMPSEKGQQRMRLVGGLGILGYFMTMSFASFDWGMSLEPHWFSSIYGVHFIIGQGLSTFCFALVVASRLAKHEPFSRWLDKSHFHDLGNLVMAFTLLWAYMSFSQFVIIWSANLPEETPWYLHRTRDGWQVLSLFLVAFHFVVPLGLLLSRRTKRNLGVLASVACAILFMRYADIYWLIKPAFHGGEAHFHIMDVIAPISLGGLWLGFFLRNLRGRPLVSLQDGHLLESLEGQAS